MAARQLVLEVGDVGVGVGQLLPDRQRFLVGDQGVLLVADLVCQIAQVEAGLGQAASDSVRVSPSAWRRSRRARKNVSGSFRRRFRRPSSAGVFFSSGSSATASRNRFTASIAICSRSSARACCALRRFLGRLPLGLRSRFAHKASPTLIAVAATSRSANAPAVASAARCLRANFDSLYDADGGHASTASPSR